MTESKRIRTKRGKIKMTNLNNLVVEKLEELTELINEIKEKANEINDKTKDISYSNLKMHEFSWLLSTEVEKRNESEESHTQAFQLAMEHTYDLFTDEEERIAYHVKREYIGRTSSFYYLTDSYGETVDSYSFNEALQGKKINIGDYLGGVNANLYDYLIQGTKTLEELWEDEDFENFEDEEEIEEFFESERSEIEKAFEDLNYLEEIVNEALQLYKLVEDYKTEDFAKLLLEDFEYLLENEEEERTILTDFQWQNVFSNLEKGEELEVLYLDGTKEWAICTEFELLEDGFKTENEAYERLGEIENKLMK